MLNRGFGDEAEERRMDSRKVLLLVAALLVAGMTALFARTIVSSSSAPQADTPVVAKPAEPETEILVATRALPVGTILDPSALKFQPWPKGLLEGAYYVKGQADVAKLQGTVLRYPITAGQPLTQGAVVQPGDRGFLAAALTPGMRAVTVPVSAQTAVAGFVFPGDRVDFVLTQDVAGGGDGPPLKASETIMRNVRVLATDQRTDNQPTDNGKTPVHTFTTVTVETTPKMAEQLAVAQTVGTLSLSLRALAEHPDEPAGGAATSPVLEHASYATGGDVSRYQRRTVPGRQRNAGPDHGTFVTPGGTAPRAARTGPVIRVARGADVTEEAEGRVPAVASAAVMGRSN